MQQDLQKLLKEEIRKRNHPTTLTVFELKTQLEDYPDDMEIVVGQLEEDLLFLEIKENQVGNKYLLLSVDQPSHSYDMQKMLNK